MDDIKKKSKTSSLIRKSSSRAYGTKSMSRVKMRQASYGFSKISGITRVDTSQIGIEYRRPVCTLLNTYQLDPRVKFDTTLVTKAAKALLDEMFTDHVYNNQGSPELAIRLADQILRKVIAMNFNRYRILSLVTIAQNRAQSYHNAVAFIWDHERDNCVNLQDELRTAFIQVTVFGIYFD